MCVRGSGEGEFKGRPVTDATTRADVVGRKGRLRRAALEGEGKAESEGALYESTLRSEKRCSQPTYAAVVAEGEDAGEGRAARALRRRGNELKTMKVSKQDKHIKKENGQNESMQTRRK